MALVPQWAWLCFVNGRGFVSVVGVVLVLQWAWRLWLSERCAGGLKGVALQWAWRLCFSGRGLGV